MRVRLRFEAMLRARSGARSWIASSSGRKEAVGKQQVIEIQWKKAGPVEISHPRHAAPPLRSRRR